MRISDWSSDVCSSDLIEMEIGGYRTAPGLDELDLRGLVPDDVVAAKLMQQHHHEKRVGHRKQAATEMTADIIAVVPALMQCDPHCAEIVRDVLHTDAGEGKRRPQVDRKSTRLNSSH